MTLSASFVVRWPTLELHMDLDVEPGSTVVIMGPNGAGKTTILRALAGLTRIQSGRIRMGDTSWDDPAARVFVPPGPRNIGLVFQDHLLFDNMTVLDNVAFGPRARGLSPADSRREAQSCLDRLELSDLGSMRPAQLSGGQSQRVALARALVNQPPLLLLDEPLASLDVVTRRRMRSEISRDLEAHHPITILVTHDPEDARTFADTVIVLEHGAVTQSGSITDLSDHPKTPYISELFAGSI